MYRKWRIQTILWLAGNCLLFAAWVAVREGTCVTVGSMHTGASIAAVLASIAFGMLLYMPQKRWLRLAVVILPSLVFGLRMIAFVLDTSPRYWVGIVTSMILIYVYAIVGPVMLPPPTTNGEAKALLKMDGVPLSVGMERIIAVAKPVDRDCDG